MNQQKFYEQFSLTNFAFLILLINEMKQMRSKIFISCEEKEKVTIQIMRLIWFGTVAKRVCRVKYKMILHKFMITRETSDHVPHVLNIGRIHLFSLVSVILIDRNRSLFGAIILAGQGVKIEFAEWNRKRFLVKNYNG